MKSVAASSVLALAAVQAAGAVSVAGKTPQCVCCAALNNEPTLAGKVWSPDNEQYTNRLAEYYSANAAQAPWCMLVPTSAEDVSTAVRVFNEHQCPFGMRSGAHSAFKGSNGIKDGVTVDFGHMNATVYDPETQLASIGPGATWETVFSSLAKDGRTTVGGRASVVGVGGFTTGGGYSFHTYTEGFAADNIVNFEVVLGDGSIVNANAQENADLWKALKGGSGNLGFVTRLDERTLGSTSMWGGITTYDLSVRSDLYDAYFNFLDAAAEDPASQQIVSCIYSKGTFTLVSVLSNIDAVAEAPAFAEHLAVESTSSTLTVGEIAELVPVFTGPTPLGLFATWQNGMITHDRAAMDFINDKQQEWTARMQEAAGPDADFEMLVQFQPFTQALVDISDARGGNVLGLDRVVADGPCLQWMIALTVDTAANQEVVLPMAVEMRREIEAYAAERGIERGWVFANYASGEQDPLASYGEESVAFLREVSERYDAGQVFQKLRQTGFKIPAAAA